MSSKVKVVVTRKLPDAVETRMMELFDTRLNLNDIALTHEELIMAVQSAEILVPTVTDNIDAEVINSAGDQLKMIANFGAGVDHVDLTAAAEKGIIITNTPDVLTEDTADLTMALVLMTPRRMGECERFVRAKEWSGWTPTFMMGNRINGKRLGIIGMGRIGTAVAERARGFGLAVHYHNRHRVNEELERELEVTYWENLDQLLTHMDIVVVTCPSTPATYHLLSEQRLKLMQPHSYVVNTSRGNIIDETALVSLLEQGLIAGAGLDVFENEPAIHPKLYDMENVVILPHIGSSTIEGRVAMGERVIVNAKTFIDGHKPPNRVLETLL
ncbi:MAG TPA: D-glycerate dehydrogenase [Rhodospirillales bacterium]|nr:D-glycerate dehydrogenase [Rhodospirillales bacterium]HJO87073.1 D-glycerate dehydrogenase [Rhodospirillales bacterium]